MQTYLFEISRTDLKHIGEAVDRKIAQRF